MAGIDEWDTCQLMPADVRLDVKKPILGRKVLESPRDMLEKVLDETGEIWLGRD